MSGMEEQFARAVEEGFSIDSQALSQAFSMNMTSQEFTELMMSMNSSEAATYEGNLTNLGYVDFDTPTLINIYPIDFESKEHVVNILDAYNSRMEAEGKDATGHNLYGHGGRPHVIGDGYNRYNQLCADRLRFFHLAGGVVHNDRCYHMYKRSGKAERRIRYPPGPSALPRGTSPRRSTPRPLSSVSAPA